VVLLLICNTEFIEVKKILNKIIEARGCVVHGEALRNGHHARRLDGKGILTTPSRASSHIRTLVGRPVLPDAKVAYNSILGIEENAGNLDVVLYTINEVENLIDEIKIAIERYQNIQEN